MSGIILFVDDKVFKDHTSEHKLYLELCKSDTYSVLPIENLEDFEAVIDSMSCIKAIILDWKFDNKTEPGEEGLKLPHATPYSILKNKIYSLIYIFSNERIEEGEEKEKIRELRSLYGDKIEINQKVNIIDSEKYARAVINSIDTMESKNKGLIIPIFWSQQINKTMQEIFWELESKDPTWIKEFYKVALDDIQPEKNGQNEAVKNAAAKEVISLFDTLLTEKLILNPKILDKIKEVESLESESSEEEKYFNVLKYLYYRQIVDNEDISTGVVIKYADKNYVIISPECDFRYILDDPDSYVDCLEFSNTFTELPHVKDAKKDKKLNALTQTQPRFHILPFGYKDQFSDLMPIVIDFRTGFRSFKTSELQDNAEKYKILKPYINEIRQRFLAYKGRIGVPAISGKLKKIIIEHSQTKKNEGTTS